MILCLKSLSRQISEENGNEIIELLLSILSEINLNDLERTILLLEFFDTIFRLITFIDCSSAISIRKDLTEVNRFYLKNVYRLI